MSAGRTLHVRCTTWEQVEIFYTRKLRRGKLLSMKVPFRTEIGTPVTLGLELPNQVVIAIDGRSRRRRRWRATRARRGSRSSWSGSPMT
jgi:hypothetical protein